MPKTEKNCILCGKELAKHRQEVNSLCPWCINKVNESFKYSIARQNRDAARAREERSWAREQRR